MSVWRTIFLKGTILTGGFLAAGLIVAVMIMDTFDSTPFARIESYSEIAKRQAFGLVIVCLLGGTIIGWILYMRQRGRGMRL